MTYFITFVCYGCHLHGDQPGGVDRHHNLPGSPTLDVDRDQAAAAHSAVTQYWQLFERCALIAIGFCWPLMFEALMFTSLSTPRLRRLGS